MKKGITTALLVAVMILAGIVLVSVTVQDALARKGFFMTSEGYRVELRRER